MKKYPAITLPPMALCFTLASLNAYAEDQTDEIEEVIVTSSFTRANLSQIENPLHVVSGETINNGLTQSLGESIDSLLGVASNDYGAAVGQPIIRGLTGDRVKTLSNGIVVRDVSGLGADHLNEVDLANIEQIEIVRGPSSLLYANGTSGGIVNVVDNAIARSNIETSSLQIGAETQTVNDGYAGVLSYAGNVGGVNITYTYKDGSYDNFEVPEGAIIHADHDEEHADDHDDEDAHEEENRYLENSDFEVTSQKLGLSKVGEWGHVGISYADQKSLYGIPFHGEHEDEHDEDHDTDHDDDHEDEHEDEHGDEHEDERIFSSTESKTLNLDGSFNLDLGPLNKLSFSYRNSDYGFTEQHEEGAHEDEHDDDEHEDEHEDEHGHGEEGPTLFTNDADEFRLVFGLDNAVLNQQLVLNTVSEDTSIIGAEAFMNPVDSSETTLGYYASKDFAGFSLDLGIRIDRTERDGSITAAEDHDEEHEDEHEEAHEDETTQHAYSATSTSFALALSRDLSDTLTLNAGLARVNRAPAATELFMNGPHLATGRYEVGDPTLDTEVSTNFDLGLRYTANGYFASISYFNNAVDDYIYLQDETEDEHEDHADDDHGGLTLANYMQSDATFNGYELEIGKTFDLATGSVTLAYARDSVIGEFDDGSNVPRIVPNRNLYSISYSGDNLDAQLMLKDVEKQTKVAANGTATDGYTMLDFSLTKAFVFPQTPTVHVAVFGNNLLDEVARNHTSFVKDEVPLPGRNFGFKFNMKI